MSDTFGPIIDDAAAGFAMFMRGGRSIGDIIPDVVMEEVHHDPAMIRVHPVETGNPVSDHMFFPPQMVEMRPAWSDSSIWGAPGYSQSIYAQLVALQQSRQPFSLVTGKRNYDNMQIRDIAVKTDVESENSLLAVVVFQQINFVDVATTGDGSTSNSDGNSTVTSANISAANAQAAGFAVDSNGNVSFPNATATGGNVQLQGVSTTAPSWGGSITGPEPPNWQQVAGSIPTTGVQ